MLSIKPILANNYNCCTACNSTNTTQLSILFQGIHLLADCICNACNTSYYHTFPLAHDAHFPISFSHSGNKKKYNVDAKTWLAEPLIQSIINKETIQPEIERKIHTKHQSIIVLNCLDFCYGHVFLKLANTPLYQKKYPDKGIVLVVPEKFEWLVPKGVAETWVVKEKLSNLTKWIKNMDNFCKEAFKDFDSVDFGQLQVHPNSTQIDWESFLQTKKFPLEEFISRPPEITFVYREDRIWLNYKLMNGVWKLCRNMGLKKYVSYFFLSIQNYLFLRTAKKIKRALPNASFSLMGMGKNSYCPSLMNDLRKDQLVPSDELAWCAHYAKSHVVIGFHGSNMLIPTALAAGFVELLPEYKIQHITEDTIQVHTNRLNHYLGRFVDEYSSTHLVANHTIKMIKGFQGFSSYLKSEL